MKLRQLLQKANINIEVKTDPDILGITTDSRKVEKGFLFFAFKGVHHNGMEFIEEAIKRGASVIVSNQNFNINFTGERLIVDDPYELSVKLAPIFFNFPSKDLNLIGITGTNGKTTISYVLESIYKKAKHKTGVIGTISYRIGDKEYDAVNTTPQAVDLQNLLSKMRDQDVDTVIMEVSSHALVLNRVAGCEFDVALFTNLTQDHLDFHKSMEDYLKAKKILFDSLGKDDSKNKKKFAVINTDDSYSKKIVKDVQVSIVTYSCKKEATVFAEDISFDLNKYMSSFRMVFENNEKININTHLLGDYNISNLCAAASVAYSQGIDFKIIKEGIESVKTVDGRFEFMKECKDFACIIDYAHTPDALERIIKSSKKLGFKRVITVFGCGGDRDRAKRPIMGEVAGKYSDYVIITSDNPRDEDPKRIVLDVELGVNKIKNSDYEIIIDRREAIDRAIRIAEKGDVIVLAGKGHEQYQIIGEEKKHFSDKEVVIEVVNKIKLENKESELF